MEVAVEERLAVEVGLVEAETHTEEQDLRPFEVPAPQQHVDVALEAARHPRPGEAQGRALEEDGLDAFSGEPVEGSGQLGVPPQVLHGRGHHAGPQVREPAGRLGPQPSLAGAEDVQQVGLDAQPGRHPGQDPEVPREAFGPPGRQAEVDEDRPFGSYGAPLQPHCTGSGKLKALTMKAAICSRGKSTSGQKRRGSVAQPLVVPSW